MAKSGLRLEDLCISAITNHIEYWTDSFEERDIKNYTYIFGPFNGLPSDCLQHILTSLIDNKRINLKTLIVLLEAGLDSLNLATMSHIIDSKWIIQLGKWCKKIEKLDMEGCKRINNKAVETIAHNCYNLSSINLAQCSRFTDSAVIELLTTKLKQLNLSGLDRITDATLKAISERCPHLQILKLNGCKSLSNYAIIELGKSCKELKELHLADCWDLEPSTLQHCLISLPKLEVLDLSLCQVDDNVIWQIGESCSVIRILILNGCGDITSKSLRHLFGNCKQLQDIELAQCNNIDNFSLLQPTAAVQVANYWRKLNLTNCSQLTDGQILHLELGNLQELYLSHCTLLSDLTLNYIGKKCQKLQILHLSSIPMITDEGFSDICAEASNSSLRHSLRHLDLSGCSGITDIGVQAIAVSFASLRHVNFSHCDHITVEGVASLLQSSTFLEILDVRHCRSISRIDYHTLDAQKKGLQQILWQ